MNQTTTKLADLPGSIMLLPFRPPVALRPAFRSVMATGTLIALLSLSGSLFAAVVYDAVIPGRGLSSLAALVALLGLAYTAQHVLEQNRSRIMRLCSIAIRDELADRVDLHDPTTILDVEMVRSFLAGRGSLALLDVPWTPVFVVVLALIHPWLGLVTLAAAATTVLASLRSITANRSPTAAARHARAARDASLRENRLLAGQASAMGMSTALRKRSELISERMDADEESALSTSASSEGAARLIRIFAQSAILAVGAMLVIDGSASGGVIFASSLLSARALGPLDAALASWLALQAARASWIRLASSDRAAGSEMNPNLPAPRRRVSVRELTVRVADVPIVSKVSFDLEAGDALVVLGPTGSGKTILLSAIAGAIDHEGAVLLDDSPTRLWNRDEIGRHRGWSPSSDAFATASVAANIARLDQQHGPEERTSVVEAAMLAGAHQSIMTMPHGYRTMLGPGSAAPSRGQTRLISLARAAHGNPFLVVMDDPMSDLDPKGEEALVSLVRAIRSRGGIAIVSGSAPRLALVCSHALVMRGGHAETFRPMADLLRPISRTDAA